MRLIAEPEVRPEDLKVLHELLTVYGEVLTRTVDRVRAELGVAPTARVKNTGTILEKLQRYGGSWLKSIQDLAGMRIVIDFDRAAQDELVARVVALFADEAKPPKVIDRRAEPVQGYRAVHVIVFPESLPVEIQIRTQLQHEWAELFEKLADRVGRGIRYGDPPQHLLWPEALLAASSADRELSQELPRLIVDNAVQLSDAIHGFEQAEPARRGLDPGPALAYFAESFAAFRNTIERLDQLVSLRPR